MAAACAHMMHEVTTQRLKMDPHISSVFKTTQRGMTLNPCYDYSAPREREWDTLTFCSPEGSLTRSHGGILIQNVEDGWATFKALRRYLLSDHRSSPASQPSPFTSPVCRVLPARSASLSLRSIPLLSPFSSHSLNCSLLFPLLFSLIVPYASSDPRHLLLVTDSN